MGLNSKEHIFFVKDVKEIDLCGSKMFYFEGSDFSKPTDFTRLKYEKHNLETCEQCRTTHVNTFNTIAERFKKFPTCCSQHAKLINEKWFNRKDFEQVPQLYADKLMFTWHHILNYIEEENWRKEIIDFIEYIFNTFGSFPIDYGEALYFKSFKEDLSDFVSRLEGVDAKKKEIMTFIAEFGKPPEGKKTDFNILMETYNQWFKMFPFDLSFFAPLKEHFAKTIPVIEEMHENKYLSLTKARLITREKLIDKLINITNTVITSINTHYLLKNGMIDNAEKIELELLMHARRQKLDEGYVNASKDPEIRYRKILKEWIHDEIDFIKKIKPVIENISHRMLDVHEAIVFACGKMQENKIFWGTDENARTKQIVDLLSLNFKVKDQSQYGKSAAGKKPGSVDAVIIDVNNTEYFIEAVNLFSVNRKLIQEHINKLEENYDSKGLPIKYLIAYCNIKNETFSDFLHGYLEFIKTDVQFRFNLLDLSEIESKYINIRQIKTTHEREGKKAVLYHLLIKMPYK